MIYKYLRVICVIAAGVLFCNAVEAQPFRHLTAGDFEGVPRDNGRGVIAYTNCTIDFSYQATRKDSYYLLNFNISLRLNSNKSWMDKRRITSRDMMAEVLKHEQGHYTIAYLEQQELLRQLGKTVFYANYQAEAMRIFNRIDAKYKQLNSDYDTDTQNMQNKAQQVSWDAYLQKRLTFMPEE